MRTTDDWAALLDGTTPGPWGHYVPRGADGHYDPVFGDVPGDEISLVKRPADWRLIAAAPEAVAEVVRLRRRLAAQGLLAEDLPEPDKDSPFVALGPTWEVRKEHGGVYAVTSRNGLVYAPGDTHSPAEARAMALALLAAADHAEKEPQ